MLLDLQLVGLKNDLHTELARPGGTATDAQSLLPSFLPVFFLSVWMMCQGEGWGLAGSLWMEFNPVLIESSTTIPF